ncbi:unnamed protein product [Discula destructiva]
MASSAPQKDTNNPTDAGNKPADDATAKKTAATLEEDDEFEDFPLEDWPAEETEAATSGKTVGHLWEESWDDDDTSDDFSQQLKEEIKKVEAANKKR